MAKLYDLDLLNHSFFIFLKLRSLLTSATTIIDLGDALADDFSYIDTFRHSCKLAKKDLIKFQPLPTLKLRLVSYARMSEKEVKASYESIGSTAYLYNAIQAETNLVGGGYVYINPAFLKKWNLSESQIIEDLPKILELYERFRTTDVQSQLLMKWLPTALGFDLKSISLEDLKALYSLGLAKNAYIFWVLQEESISNLGQIDLKSLSNATGVSIRDFISSLSTLQKNKILDFSIENVEIFWSKLKIPEVSELSIIGEMLKPEAKILYQFKAEPEPLINVASFCKANAITESDFYIYLSKLKSKDILDYSVDNMAFSWRYSYSPR
ncbi:hypothetical protein [Scytonema sp. PCC 10023]|uniref:hypothetical protein n=1 Tax=Scytonema sp. PCC 10023 TaxID=1680591 RepID=UPI0039C73B49